MNSADTNENRLEQPAITSSTNVPLAALPFSAYKGNEPYMFISYAHKDSGEVYPILSQFHRQGYHAWYDEGIEPGIEWPEEIANALNTSSLFVVFITPNSVASENVRNEINFALAKKTPFIAIYLKPTTLTPGLQLQIGSKQAILKYQLDEDTYTRKYSYSFDSVLKPTGKVNPEDQTNQKTVVQIPPVSAAPIPAKPLPEAPQPAPAQVQSVQMPLTGQLNFVCDLARKAACEQIGFPADRQLESKHAAAVQKLKFFANAFGEPYLTSYKHKDHIMVHKRQGASEVFYDRGDIFDLSDFAYFRNLNNLVLIFQKFKDLSPLHGLPIRSLDISCNQLSSLAPLATLQQLKTLYLDFSSYESLLPLDQLNQLNVFSANDISPSAFGELCQLSLPNLLHLNISESKLESLNGVSALKSLTTLEIKNCVCFEFEDILQLPKLDTLYMYGTKCFDYSFLAKMPALKRLGLDEVNKAVVIDTLGYKPEFLS